MGRVGAVCMLVVAARGTARRRLRTKQGSASCKKETSGPTCNAHCITRFPLLCEENALPCCRPGIEATSLVGGSMLWDAAAPHDTDTCTKNRVAIPLTHNSNRTSRIHEILGAPVLAKNSNCHVAAGAWLGDGVPWPCGRPDTDDL